MTNTEYRHQYRIGDAVLARMDGAQIPGVIEDEQGGRFQVRLSQPWADETGNSADTAWLTPDQLAPFLNQETGGEDALPG